MLVSAREQVISQWTELQSKYASPILTVFLKEFKSESFDAEQRLVNKIQRTGNTWKTSVEEPDVVDGMIFIPSTNDDSSVMSLNLIPGKSETWFSPAAATVEIEGGGKGNNMLSKMFENVFGIKVCTSVETGPTADEAKNIDSLIEDIRKAAR